MVKGWRITLRLTVLGLLSVLWMTLPVLAEENEKTVVEGVFVEGIDMSGKTLAEAEAALEDYMSGLKQKQVILTDEDDSLEISLGDIGLSTSADDILEEIFSLGESGNIVQRYKELADVKNQKKEYTLEFTYDAASLNAIIDERSGEVNRQPSDAYLTRQDGELVLISALKGRTLNVEATARSVEDVFNQNWDRESIRVEMSLEVVEASVKDDDLSMIKDRLSSYTTNYSGSDYGRRENIKNGASKIDGMILQPGEEFSFLESVNPMDGDNGYHLGSAYNAGKIVQSYGGGICQVSSTLYNAVLRAELEIVSRTNHSMTVNYVPLAADATIANPSLDFKFKNDQDYPVYIDAMANDSEITISIYGMETRPENRSISFYSVTEQTISPPADVVTKDSSQYEGYEYVTQGSHTGYVAALYKEVYVDDVLQDTILINRSSYQATPRYVIKGSKKAVQEKNDSSDAGDTAED